MPQKMDVSFEKYAESTKDRTFSKVAPLDTQVNWINLYKNGS